MGPRPLRPVRAGDRARRPAAAACPATGAPGVPRSTHRWSSSAAAPDARSVLLGTGSADGWPNPFCTCASCTERADRRAAARPDGRAGRRRPAARLRTGDPARRAARRASTSSRVRHVLVTHAHPDHCAPAFLLFRSWVGDGPLDVLGPSSVVEQARMWVAPDSPVRFTVVAPGERLPVGGYDVRVLEARTRRRRRPVRRRRPDRTACSTRPTRVRCPTRPWRRCGEPGSTSS